MKQFFKELLEYGHHFNQKLGDVFISHPSNMPERSVKLYNHILNAHHIWNNRINAKQAAFGVWEIHPAQEYKEIDKLSYEQSLLIIDKPDLNGVITYSNTRGQVFKNSIRDILFHVINHSTYHRGQIATDFRQHGLEPLATDYIFYKR